MAGRKQVSSGAAVAMAVALLALLVAAGEAGKCKNVDEGTVMKQCLPYCMGGGGPSQGCCAELRKTTFRCLCDNYWNKFEGTKLATCAKKIPLACGVTGARESCDGGRH